MSFLNVNLTLTGDCSNTSLGAIVLQGTGTAPNFVVSDYTGTTLPTSAFTTTAFTYTVDGLSAGNYILKVQDSTIPTNIVRYESFYISSGSTVSANSKDTTCNLSNGSITGFTSLNYGVPSFTLFDISGNTSLFS